MTNLKSKKRESVEFSKIHQRLLQEVTRRASREFNETLQLIYDDLGIDVKVFESGGFILRQDFSGIDFPASAEIKEVSKEEEEK